MKFGNPLGSTVAISNATFPVTGTVNANITNASIPVTGSVSANITNASIPVTGNVSANITNASITVSGTVSLTSGTTVGVSSIASTVNVSVPGTVNVQGVVGGTAIGIAGSVTITSGTVNIGTVAGNITVSQIINDVNVLEAVESLIPGGSASNNFATTPLYNSGTITPTASILGVKVQMTSVNLNEIFNIEVTNVTSSQSVACLVQQPTLFGPLSSGPIAFFPIAADAGDHITISIQHISGTAATNATITAVGIGAPVVSNTMPGWPLATYEYGGLLRASVSVGDNASGTLLATPPPGMAYRLHRYGIKPAQGLTAQQGFVVGISDTAGQIDAQQVMLPTTSTIVAGSWPLYGAISNLAVTAFQVNGHSNTFVIWCTYDLVSVPLLQ